MSWDDKCDGEEKIDYLNAESPEVTIDVTEEKRIILEEHDSPPQDKFGIVYLIFLLNGIGVLLPWNMFITIAPDYYLNYWFSFGTNDQYGTKFMSALGITSQIPNFLMSLVSVSQIIRGPILWRIMGSLVVNILLIAVILLLVIVQQPEPKAEHWFYVVSLLIVLAMNASNGMYQNSMFGLAADFPGRFINSLVFGNNICGTFTSVLAIITTLAFPGKHETIALLYFSISLVVVILCLMSLLVVTRFDLYKYYTRLGEARRAADNSQRIASFSDVIDVLINQYWATIKICWPQFLNIFLTFFVSLAIFPTVLVGMPIPKAYVSCKTTTLANGTNVLVTDSPTGFTTFGNIYYDVTVFLNFNLMAAIGNFVAGFIQFPSKRFLFIPVFARLLFIPFFMLCQYNSSTDYYCANNNNAYRTMDTLFDSAWFWVIGNTILSFTSGYFSSLGMMYAPGSAPPHLQKVAGQISALCLVGGIMAGVGFTPAITSMVEHIH